MAVESGFQFWVVCDNCADSSSIELASGDEQQALNVWAHMDGQTIYGRHLCEECWEWCHHCAEVRVATGELCVTCEREAGEQ